MKRGLAVLDEQEVTSAEFRERIEQLRSRVRESNCDAALLYGDVSQSDDLAYLTNLCLYWNEAALLVPSTGPPVLFTKLSPRVHAWIRRTTVLEEIRSTNRLEDSIAIFAQDAQLGKIGLIEYALWPRGIAESMEGRDALEIEALGSWVRHERSQPSVATLSLLRQAGIVLSSAFEEAGRQDDLSPEKVFAALDLRTRRKGFADVDVECNSRPGGGLAARVTGQYRYIWVAAARTWLEGPVPNAVQVARKAYAAVCSSLRAGVSREALQDEAAKFLGRNGAIWRLDLVDQVDLSSLGEIARVADLPTLPIRSGSVVSALLETWTPDGVVRLGDTFRVHNESAEVLTG